MKNGTLVSAYLDYCGETTRLMHSGIVSDAQEATRRVESDHAGNLYQACLDDGWTVADIDDAFERRFNFRVNRSGR
jgi:hypothetical protein